MKTRSASLLHSKLDALWYCKVGEVRRIVRTASSIQRRQGEVDKYLGRYPLKLGEPREGK
jgi:hypothetical protein